MDAVQYINENKDVVQLLHKVHAENIREDNVYIRSCCPIHGGDNPTAFVINKENGLWYCHTGACGGGDIFTLVQKTHNLNFQEAVLWLAELFGLDINNLEIKARQENYIKEVQNFISVMKKLVPISRSEVTLDFQMKPVVKLRNFKEETLKHFDVQYAEEVPLHNVSGTSYKLNNRLVFPIIVAGKIVGYSLRATRASQVPKWSHQPAGLPTRELLYNIDSIKEYPDKNITSVVEGIFDVLACYEAGIVPVVATFGAHLTDMQYKLLLKTGKDVCLMYDNDDAGRLATRTAIEKLKYKTNIYLPTLPENKDPESISREELKLIYDNKRKILKY